MELRNYILKDGVNVQGNPIPREIIRFLKTHTLRDKDFFECFRHGTCHIVENCANTDEWKDNYKEYLNVIYTWYDEVMEERNYD